MTYNPEVASVVGGRPIEKREENPQTSSDINWDRGSYRTTPPLHREAQAKAHNKNPNYAPTKSEILGNNLT